MGNNLLRILLVDKNSVFLEVTKQLLTINQNFTVETATSANEALRKLAAAPFNIIVSAYVMPGKDGLQLLDELRKNNNNIPFILFTGKAREEIAIKALNLGANYYVNKHGKPEVVYGELVHAINSVVDATNAVESSREYEMRFRSFFENSLDGLLLTKPDGTILEANPQICNMLGMTEAEIKKVGRNKVVVNNEKLAAALKKRKKLGHEIAELTMRRKDGTTFDVEVTSKVYTDTDGDSKTSMVIRQITERKEAEKQLGLLARLFDLATDTILATDLEGNLVYFNEATYEQRGYSKEEMSKMSLRELDAPESTELFKSRVKMLLEEGSAVFEVEHVRKDKSRFPVEVHARIVDIGGKKMILGVLRDITRRKNAENALRASEERLNRSQEIAHLGSWELDLVTNKLSWSDEVYRIFGLKPKEFRATYEAFLEAVYPEDRAAVDAAYSNSVRDGRDGYEIEHRIVRKHTGEIRIVLEKCTHIRDAAGKIVRSIGMVHDITESKKAQEKLGQSNMIFENSLDMFCIAGFDGYFKILNPAWSRTLGWSDDELRSKPWIEFVLPEDREATNTARTTLVGGQKVFQFENRYVCRNGQFRWLSWNAIPYPNEKIIFAVARDVTDSKKVEEALRASEEKFANLFQFSPNAIVLAHMSDGVIVDFNESTTSISGYSREDLIGRSIFDLEVWANPEERDYFSKELATAGFIRNYEFGIRKKDGTVGIAYVSATAVQIQGDCYILITFSDITELKTLRDALSISEEKYRSLFSLMNESFCLCELIYDKSGRAIDYKILEINSVYERITKTKGEKIRGKRVSELHVSHEVPYLDVYAKVVETGEPARFEGYFPQLKKYFAISVFSPSKGKFATLFIDTTERRKQEQIIKESQKKFELLFTKNPAAVVLLDKDLRVKEVNLTFANLFGYSPEEMCNKFLHHLIVPDRLKRESEELREKGKTGKAELETLRKRKDGTEFRVYISLEPIVEGGKLKGFVVVYTDISERVKAQELLQAAFWKAEVLNEKLSVVGGLTRHDVRNKLMAITGQSYLLQKRMGDNTIVKTATEKIDSLVAQATHLLEFSRIYEKIGMEQLHPINAEDCFNVAASMIPELKKLQVSNELAGLQVIADSLLTQAFYNFMDNSLKHGAKVTKIRAHFTEREGKVKLFYEDDGVGIPEAAKAKLFTEDSLATKKAVHGLLLTKKLMEVYGWEITENGEPGKGVKFAITIPKIQP